MKPGYSFFTPVLLFYPLFLSKSARQIDAAIGLSNLFFTAFFTSDWNL